VLGFRCCGNIENKVKRRSERREGQKHALVHMTDRRIFSVSAGYLESGLGLLKVVFTVLPRRVGVYSTRLQLGLKVGSYDKFVIL
jgi:hypothetical protein